MKVREPIEKDSSSHLVHHSAKPVMLTECKGPVSFRCDYRSDGTLITPQQNGASSPECPTTVRYLNFFFYSTQLTSYRPIMRAASLALKHPLMALSGAAPLALNLSRAGRRSSRLGSTTPRRSRGCRRRGEGRRDELVCSPGNAAGRIAKRVA